MITLLVIAALLYFILKKSNVDIKMTSQDINSKTTTDTKEVGKPRYITNTVSSYSIYPNVEVPKGSLKDIIARERQINVADKKDNTTQQKETTKTTNIFNVTNTDKPILPPPNPKPSRPTVINVTDRTGREEPRREEPGREEPGRNRETRDNIMPNNGRTGRYNSSINAAI